jgi:predicted transcriptional regulator
MACINNDGTLTESARRLLGKLTVPCAVEELSQRIGQPMFRIRSSLREMEAAGLVQPIDGKYLMTEAGRKLTADS